MGGGAATESIANVTDIHEGLHFTGEGENTGIWSLRWSADSREIIAGTGDQSLYIYDTTQVGGWLAAAAAAGPVRSGCLPSGGAARGPAPSAAPEQAPRRRRLRQPAGSWQPAAAAEPPSL